MLCVWLPLLRVVLGNVPNAHLLGSLCPGGRASWLSLAPPRPRSLPGNNGVFWDGADGEASGSVKPLARSSVSLLPIERRRVGVGGFCTLLQGGVTSWVGPTLIMWTVATHTKIPSPPKKIQRKWTCDEVMRFYSSVENKKRARHREGDLDPHQQCDSVTFMTLTINCATVLSVYLYLRAWRGHITPLTCENIRCGIHG